jgi:glyoxylase-like metal-dependent hydrolase (beta-lactamase superfamily II)
MTTPEQAAAMVETVRPSTSTRAPIVINTHADYDHAWGNVFFSQPGGDFPAPIIASRKTGERLRSAADHDYLAERKSREPDLARVRLVPPTIEVEGRCVIDGGDLTIEIIPTPGHTDDHISVWIPEIRMLLTGDAAEHPFPYCGKRADIDTLLESLHILRQLRPATVIPCHGGPSDQGLLVRNARYFTRLDRAIRHAQDAESLAPGWYAASIDLGAQIGYSFEAAVQEQGSNPAGISDFYRESHNLAIRAVASRAERGKPPLVI